MGISGNAILIQTATWIGPEKYAAGASRRKVEGVGKAISHSATDHIRRSHDDTGAQLNVGICDAVRHLPCSPDRGPRWQGDVGNSEAETQHLRTDVQSRRSNGAWESARICVSGIERAGLGCCFVFQSTTHIGRRGR